MPEKTKPGAVLHCLRCGYPHEGDPIWRQRGPNPPKFCQNCGSSKWQTRATGLVTVMKKPKLMEKSEPLDFYQGTRIFHRNGRYGTIISPKNGRKSTTLVTLILDNQEISYKVPIEKLKIVQAVD